MGIDVQLETERGVVIERLLDRAGAIALAARAAYGDDAYDCLRYVDWEGTTVFNHEQADALLNDLERVSGRAWNLDERLALDDLIALVRRLRDAGAQHQYLRFVGE